MMHAAPRKKQSSKTIPWVLVFCAGFLAGIFFSRLVLDPSTTQFLREPLARRTKGVIEHLSSFPYRPTSHVDPKQKSSIMKQQLIEPFEIPNIAGFSIATLRPGQTVTEHVHESMIEVFFVLSGQGAISINQHETSIRSGHFILVAPGERHSLWVDNDASGESSEDMVFLALGIAEGPKPRRRLLQMII